MDIVFSSTTQLATAILAGHVSATEVLEAHLAQIAIFNYSGHPAIVLPYKLDKNGLPIGVQIIGKRWDESRLLGIAKALSEVTGIFQRPPHS